MNIKLSKEELVPFADMVVAYLFTVRDEIGFGRMNEKDEEFGTNVKLINRLMKLLKDNETEL
jgi:hypothetical protein